MSSEYAVEISKIIAELNGCEDYSLPAARLFASLLRPISRMPFDLGCEALSNIIASSERFSSWPEYDVMLGAQKFARGDRLGAYFHFISAAKDGRMPIGSFRGAACIRPWSEQPSWTELRPRRRVLRNPIEWIVDPEPSSLTILASCDPVYFMRFVNTFLAGLRNSTTRIHFHLIGWNASCDAIARDLRRIGGISVSMERYIYTEDRTYFATARFMRAFELMRVLGPVYISDIDNIFVDLPENKLAIWRKYDVAIKLNQWARWLPWLAPNAGYVYINDTGLGLEFALRLSNYVDHHFSPNGRANWYFDQLLLNEVLEFTRAKVLKFTPRTLVCQGRPTGDQKP